MRLLILKDKSIRQSEFDTVLKQFKDIYLEVGIVVDATVEEYYWGDPDDEPIGVLWEEYYSGYYGIKKTFLTALVSTVQKKHGKKFDHIALEIDAKNFYGTVPTNQVWGWNISAGILGYDLQVCRFDTTSRKKATRIANSLGTLYHEVMHCHAHYPYKIYNIKIEKYLKTKGLVMTKWGEDVVHGRQPEWEYIRWKENIEALKAISDILNVCYETKKIQDEDGLTAWQALKQNVRTSIIKVTQTYAE